MMVMEGTALAKGMDSLHRDPPPASHPQLDQTRHPSHGGLPRQLLPPSPERPLPSPAPLVRPRSVDDLLDGSAAGVPSLGRSDGDPKGESRRPALEDLAESEVFVGSEEDEDDEDPLRPDCQPTSLTISYHDEARLPLHAVKEEVEAEEAEEAAMSLQRASLSPPALGNSSSVPLNRMHSPPATSGIPTLSSSSPFMMMNSVNSLNNEVCSGSSNGGYSSRRFGGSMSQSVVCLGSSGSNGGKVRNGDTITDALSKSVDVLEDDLSEFSHSYGGMGMSMNSCHDSDDLHHDHNGHNGGTIGGSIYGNHEIDLTDGIPSLGDLSCPGIDEGVNLDHSPYSEGSPLSHSLASSVASNMSLDDTLSSRTDTSSFTDTQDTVVAIVQKNPCSRLPHKDSSNQSRASPRPVRPGSGKSSQVVQGHKSQNVLEPGSKTSESRRRSGQGGASPRLDGSKRSSLSYAKPTGTPSRNSPRLSGTAEDKKRVLNAPAHDRRTCRNSSSLGTTVASRSKVADLERKGKVEPIKADTKDSKLSEPRYGTLERKKKEKAANEDEFDSSTLGRRRKRSDSKEQRSEIPCTTWRTSDNKEIEKYGTLGRRKKVREAGDGREESHGALTKENKDTLDTYATLPRRKAREMTARWREQNLVSHPTEPHQTIPTIPTISLHVQDTSSSGRPLRRSRSIGKGESSRSISSYASINTSTFVRSTPRPSPRVNQAVTPPVPSPRPATATQTPRKERTIICLETAIQTALLGHEVAAAMKALARVRSQDDKLDPARPKVEIVRDYPLPLPPKPKPMQCNAQVQADGGWGSCGCPSRPVEHEELQRRLREERQAKEEVQAELDRTSTKIKDMLASMEGVEKEFNQRCSSLVVLESQLQQSAQCNSRMQDRLSQYEDYTNNMRKELSTCQQREHQLQQQVIDLESESRELAEFMGSEKEALTECLREAEAEAGRLRQLCEDREAQIEFREQEATALAKMAEERRAEVEALSRELQSVQGRTRDLMVCQGAQVSSAAVTLSHLAARLQALTSRLVHDYSVSEADLQNIVTPSESDSSASSSSTASPEHKLSPYNGLPPPHSGIRAPSPRRSPTSFIHALLHALRGGPHTTALHPKQAKDGRNSPDGSESLEAGQGDKDGDGSVSLVDQVAEVDVLLSRFLKVCCVLKNDSDAVMNEVQEENERLSQEVRSQQQLIEQQQSDYEQLSRAETRAQRQLTALTRDKGMSGDVRRSLSMDCDSQLQEAGTMNKAWPTRQPQYGGREGAASDHNAALLQSALTTLEGMPDVVSSHPNLKHLLNSLRAHSFATSFFPATLARAVSSSTNGRVTQTTSIPETDHPMQGCSSASSNGVLERATQEDCVDASLLLSVESLKLSEATTESCNGDDKQQEDAMVVGSNLNEVIGVAVTPSDGETGNDAGIADDRSNGNCFEGAPNQRPPSRNSDVPDVLFDLNANPPTLDLSSPTDDAVEQSSPTKMSPNGMTSPRAVTSPNSLKSCPHSPLLQKSPLGSTPLLSPHSSPNADKSSQVMPCQPAIFVRTETHL